MNYMPEVLKMLGVEVEEKFNIKPLINNPYYFTQHHVLINKKGHVVEDEKIVNILIGNCEIEKLPWKPKYKENYYYICTDGTITRAVFYGSLSDYYLFNAENCFRTIGDITPSIKDRVLREMKEKYENE